MIPVDFPGTNIELVKPNGWKDEDCMALPALKEFGDKGEAMYTEAWMPSYEDLKALNSGRPVMIRLYASCIPIAVWTVDESGKCNDE